MKELFKHFSVLDKLNTVFLLLIFVLYLFSLPNSPYSYEPLIVFLLTALSVFLSVHLRKTGKRSGPAKYFRLFYPLVYLFVIFESFFMILPFLNQHRYDQMLSHIDYAMLGVHPTVWIEQWNTPWLTDLMYALYLFYFPMPLFILVWLYKKRRFEDLDKAVFVYMLTYYGAYIGYFLVPAAGPRFFEPLLQLQQKDLDGVFIAVPVRHLINFLEPNKLDAFPSLHAAISFTTLLTMAKYNKKKFLIFLPVITGIMISLVYCRYHYVADIVAGIVWSIITFIFGHWFYDRFVSGKTPLLYTE
jgi:membrane-associated phospholipid phosphatase